MSMIHSSHQYHWVSYFISINWVCFDVQIWRYIRWTFMVIHWDLIGMYNEQIQIVSLKICFRHFSDSIFKIFWYLPSRILFIKHCVRKTIFKLHNYNDLQNCIWMPSQKENSLNQYKIMSKIVFLFEDRKIFS